MPCIACLALGALLGSGWAHSPSNEASESIPATAATAPRGAPSCPPPASFLATGNRPSLEEIRIALREELRAELGAYRPPSEEAEAEAHVPKEGVEERRRLAHDQARQVLGEAVRYGAWTLESRQRFRGTLHELSIPQQNQLIGELFSAIQSGRLKVDELDPPL
ncbi:hypothetical protein HPC49_30325 [Pyxidicoccus fallax]|uniref:Lipoprotein n=1 Tax=Pyxidicoccus fallax TaxID=394095 RepID=A0A848LLF8_9BACT|nr:hypothetical protein [Pyxidicoccus fallax]NMO18588.1 hypothetical protein [Pyxidicoccus fallax]NPC82505.1 hypothetical protein [Pyxidicoccus fallax]